MPDPATVIAVNYHRIGVTDPANPFHRLHTVHGDVFAQQVDLMQRLGRIVSPDQVRACADLADVNFVVCFDDVPTSAMAGIDLMRERGLPVTVSVSGHLADRGWGTRDKVYAIEKYAPREAIEARVRSLSPTLLPGLAAGQGALSFYHLTKSAALDPALVRAELVDPLFQTVHDQARPYFDQRGYLSWPQVRDLADDRLVTVANHTYGHDNLAAMPRAAVREEIYRSDAHVAEQLGRRAGYFTIPFGRFAQELALDCLEPLTALGYAGILWVGEAGLLVRGPYRRQILQLPRLHAESTLNAFAEQVRHAIQGSLDAVVWQVPATPHRRPVTVVAGSDAHRSCQVEMVLRQGKDYASDPAFYAYQFTANPYKQDRPDYYAVECDGRIEATAYNFHTSFAIEGHDVPGVYLSSWRKLPHAHPAAAAMLLHTMLAREPVVGVYHPNPAICAAFTGWQQVPVQRLTLAVPAAPRPALQPGYQVCESAEFPAELTGLCSESIGRAGFTVARDTVYQQWRHGSYPLATTAYLLLYRDGEPVAVAVVLHSGDVVSVADFHLRSTADTAPLLRAVLAFASRRSAVTVDWETSSPAVAQVAVQEFRATSTNFVNFYHLNPELLGQVGVADGLARRWPALAFHETGTTGDVLVR